MVRAVCASGIGGIPQGDAEEAPGVVDGQVAQRGGVGGVEISGAQLHVVQVLQGGARLGGGADDGAHERVDQEDIGEQIAHGVEVVR